MKTYIVTAESGPDNRDCHFHRAVEAVFLRDGAEITFTVREGGLDSPPALVMVVRMRVSITCDVLEVQS